MADQGNAKPHRKLLYSKIGIYLKRIIQNSKIQLKHFDNYYIVILQLQIIFVIFK